MTDLKKKRRLNLSLILTLLGIFLNPLNAFEGESSSEEVIAQEKKEIIQWLEKNTDLCQRSSGSVPCSPFPDSPQKVNALLQQFTYLGLGYDSKNSKIDSIPEGIRHLQNMISLDISNIPLSSLPSSLGELKKLKYLKIENTAIKELPESLGKLENLTNLELARNRLESLPQSLGALKKLKVIDLSDNQLQKIPSQLANLTPRSLNLYRNPIKEVSVEAEMMKGENGYYLINKYFFHHDFSQEDYIAACKDKDKDKDLANPLVTMKDNKCFCHPTQSFINPFGEVSLELCRAARKRQEICQGENVSVKSNSCFCKSLGVYLEPEGEEKFLNELEQEDFKLNNLPDYVRMCNEEEENLQQTDSSTLFKRLQYYLDQIPFGEENRLTRICGEDLREQLDREDVRARMLRELHPYQGARTTKIVGKRKTAFGTLNLVKRKLLQDSGEEDDGEELEEIRELAYWEDQRDMVGEQFNPQFGFYSLGPVVGPYFGYNQLSEDIVSIPEIDHLQKAAKNLLPFNLGVSMAEATGQEKEEEYLRGFYQKAELPLATMDEDGDETYQHHDHIHFPGFARIPAPITQVGRNQVEIQFDFETYLKNFHKVLYDHPVISHYLFELKRAKVEGIDVGTARMTLYLAREQLGGQNSSEDELWNGIRSFYLSGRLSALDYFKSLFLGGEGLSMLGPSLEKKLKQAAQTYLDQLTTQTENKQKLERFQEEVVFEGKKLSEQGSLADESEIFWRMVEKRMSDLEEAVKAASSFKN